LNAQPAFGFGSTTTTTANPIQSLAAPSVASGGFSFAPTPSTVPAATSGGFAFTPSSSTAAPPPPVFGASPSGFSSGLSFGATPTFPTNIPPFQFAAGTPPTTADNSFTTSGSTAEPPK
jgi:hypothetical protein